MIKSVCKTKFMSRRALLRLADRGCEAESAGGIYFRRQIISAEKFNKNTPSRWSARRGVFLIWGHHMKTSMKFKRFHLYFIMLDTSEQVQISPKKSEISSRSHNCSEFHLFACIVKAL